MIPLTTFNNGASFGDVALMSKKPRAGTVLTLSDCHFAVIGSDSFDKLLMRVKFLKLQKNVQFLRNIPYLSNSTVREIHGLFLLFSEHTCLERGQTLVHEDTSCDKVIIVAKGEMEIVKSNLSTVFYNHETGTLGIRESNEKAKMLKSEYVERDDAYGSYCPSKGRIVSSMAVYQGSEFHSTI